ncbi:Peptidase M30, hyicolysin [Brachyspira hampsonii 30446]|uniref:Peptidase M30, hyicolysin n=1 Tax=Brachyspira hampsonii 30446 TaxID=1289135 RepID=A0A2U4F674_9SPIR|nr:peptidase M30 [Brachyspira hampsonii]EKV56570.1 Peptidase M30, hyicolysin [Brachyspira hampsonii 30446]OEJ19643.1 peptidase M30 [Brachyspira hampsonii]
MKKILFIISILILSIISCNRNNVTNPIESSGGLIYPSGSMEKKTFYAYYRMQENKLCNFYKVAEYDKLIVYVMEGSGYKPESVDYIANVFNNNYAEEVRIYGEHTDVDKNGKIIILLLELNDSHSVAIYNGYFDSADLLLNQNNNAEILYMDIEIVNEDPEYMSSTILHELQHLINFNVNYIKNGREMSTWLNEALSESTSILFSPLKVSSRIDGFNSMGGYYCFYTWNLPTENVFPNNPTSKYLFANYPSVSVFMNWLYQKNAQNSSVFQNIAKFSSDTDIDRVLKNVSFIGASSWDDLLFKWIEGINNGEVAGAEIKVQKENNNINLYPGALVVYNGSLTQSGNLVTKQFQNGFEFALNNDTYIGDNPTSINITTPKASSVQASKMYETVNDIFYISKERHILFDKDGKIKEY